MRDIVENWQERKTKMVKLLLFYVVDEYDVGELVLDFGFYTP